VGIDEVETALDRASIFDPARSIFLRDLGVWFCSETLLKPTWMLSHRCRANEKEEQTDDARLQQQIMIVAHGSWVMLSTLLEPAALCAAGSFYVRGRLREERCFAMQRSGAGAAWI
jgi:hypothetical protein